MGKTASPILAYAKSLSRLLYQGTIQRRNVRTLINNEAFKALWQHLSFFLKYNDIVPASDSINDRVIIKKKID